MVALDGLDAGVDLTVQDNILESNDTALTLADSEGPVDGVRLLGSGEIKAKVAFSVWGASKSAVAAVEKAGGSVTILAPKRGSDEQNA